MMLAGMAEDDNDDVKDTCRVIAGIFWSGRLGVSLVFSLFIRLEMVSE